jgi:3-oxoacid CoA-transferase subunit B
MDLAAGGGELIVIMYHATRDGESKLVRRCTYPLTAIGCTSCVVTNLALIEVVRGTGFVLREVAPGVSVDDVRSATAAPLHVAPDLTEMQFD